VERRPSNNATHVGRGGEGNVFKPGSAEAEAAKKAQDKNDSAIADELKEPKTSNMADKVKSSLLGKK
jgi:hypothetical protein